MYDDNDMKIFVSNSLSDKADNSNISNSNISSADVNKGRRLGVEIAHKFTDAVESFSDDIEGVDTAMLLQRQLLLSFTVTVTLEEYCGDDIISGVAQKSFLDYLKQKSSVLYNNSSDTGAFSFYYLAFRRGNDIERRIGQTFAMLCSHDGDPIYQELGEALYCWFASAVKATIDDYGFLK